MFNLVATLGLLLCALGKAAVAQGVDQRFCIVPVTYGARGDGPAGESWRLTDSRFDIPGLPAPVFTPAASFAGPWTIDSDRREIPYKGLFPRSYLDIGDWGREPWSGRVVAVHGGHVFVLNPAADHFEEIEGAAGKGGKYFGSIAVLPRRRMTIAVDNNGVPFVVAANTLQPWLSPDELAAHGVHGIRRLYDSPFLSAVIIRDKENTLHALTDDDKWYRVGSVDSSISDDFVDAPKSGAALLVDLHSVVVIRKNGAGAAVSFASNTIDGQDFYVSKLFGQLVGFRTPLFRRGRWQHLTPEGFNDIPGGDFAPGTPAAYVRDQPTLGLTLFQGSTGLYLYDGATMEPVKGEARESLVYDLPSIGRVLVVTQSGIFEVTRDGTLVSRPMPFPATGVFPEPQLADWPQAGVALVATRAGVFSLDRDLNARPVLGGDQIDLGGLDFAHGTMASTGDLILTGRNGVFLAVDGRGGGAALCQQERDVRRAIPESMLCLKGVPGSDEASIGFAIGGIIEAPRDQGLLVDAISGLFLQRPNGSFKNLAPRGGQYTRGLVALPWSNDVLTTGPDGTVVRSDLSLERLHQWVLPKVISRSIGGALVTAGEGEHAPQLLQLDKGTYRLRTLNMPSVDVAVDAPWFGGVLVSGGAGLSLVRGDGSLTPFKFANAASPPRPALSAAFYARVAFGVSDVFAIDRLQTIYAREQHGGWFRLTKDRAWLPVEGLPNQLALAHFDPGKGEALFGMGSGIYAVGRDGKARKLDGPGAPGSIVRAFASAGHSILAGGNEGLFEVSEDLSHVAPLAHGSADSIGSVFAILDVGFAGFDIVETSSGTYAFEDGELKRVPALSSVARADNLTVLPRLRRVLATKSSERGPLLFELGRNDQNGQCGRLTVEPR